jgi:hypothetical protein
MHLRNLPAFDWKTIPNSLLHGTFSPPKCAKVSFSVRWDGALRIKELRNETHRFEGRFIEDIARVSFTSEQPGFRFISDPEETSSSVFSEIGRERNGVFFSTNSEEDADRAG